MPTKSYTLPEWLPDLAATGTLTLARNCRPIANGYAPIGSFSAITPTLGATFQGGAAFVSSTGVASLLSATNAALRKYSGIAWSSVLTVATSGRWRFAQFGDNVVYAHGGQLGSYNLNTGVAAAISGAPVATDVATVRDFVFALVDGNSAVGWSGFNDSSQWAMDGITNQSDKQPLLSGGLGVALVGGEYGLVLQKNAIKRVSYVGGDTIFQFDEISSEIGCMSQGSVVTVGKMTFFLSERGFMMCDGQTVTPVADQKFNKWFFDQYARADLVKMWSAVDPRRNLVLWGVPGNPGNIIAYNWVLNRATYLWLPFSGLFTGFSANIALEQVDTLYPGGLDSIPLSLDDATFNGGNPLLLVVDTNNQVGSFTGSNMSASFVMRNVEPTPGRRSRVRSIRPVTDANPFAAALDARMKTGDTPRTVPAGSMRASGKMPVRGANGRYVNVVMTVPAAITWTYVQGFELEFEPAEGR